MEVFLSRQRQRSMPFFVLRDKKTSLKVWRYQEYSLLLRSELEQAEKNGCDEDSNE